MRTAGLIAGAVVVALGASAGWGQATRPAEGPVEAAVHDLVAEDFGVREKAGKRLEGLLAQQLKERAQVQGVIQDLQGELEHQVRTLGMVGDEEARQRMAGLVEMEEGLAAWTQTAMTAPADRRKALLEWGLSSAQAPLLARAYGRDRAKRVAAIKALGKVDGDGADWTLAQLMSDREMWIRAAAMAAAWDKKPTPELIAAAWYRGVDKRERETDAEQAANNMQQDANPEEPRQLEIEIPGRDPIEVPSDDEGDTNDADIAVALLIHMNSPAIAEKVQGLIARRVKKDQPLDDVWVHRLAEGYKVKEAVPLLARVALGDMQQEGNSAIDGDPVIATNRSSAAGALAVICGIDPATWELRAGPRGQDLGWWVEGEKGDTAAVMKFFEWWKVHYKEFGVTEEPSVPPAGDRDDQADDPLEAHPLGPPEPAELERQHAQQERGFRGPRFRRGMPMMMR